MSEPEVAFDQFNLVVTDMGRTVAFYELLGLEIPDTAPEWQDHHRAARLAHGVDLEFDSLAFARIYNRGWPPRVGGASGILGFKVGSREDVDTTYKRVVAAGHAGQQAPYDTFWGARYAVVQDPDGNAVGIMSPSDPARRSRPPAPP